MCVVCGCADAGKGATVESGVGGALPHGHDHEHEHEHEDDRDHGPSHVHRHEHDHDHHAAHAHAHADAHVHVDPRHGDLHFGAGAARVSVPGMSQSRTVRLEADILGENKRIAEQNRRHFEAHGVTALNLLSSPGSGKTTLLCATIEALKASAPTLATSVIEGDQQTSFDADRIRVTGAPAIQVNTGKGCHLDAPMVAEAFSRLHHHGHEQGHGHDDTRSLLFIENVGNLVCPALWDLGEAAKIVVLSVTEGEDKPLKYPDMFAAAQLMLLNKVDLLPHLQFDVQRCIAAARRVNPAIEVLQLSATTGQGMPAWLAWLMQRCRSEGAGDTQARLRQQVAELEAALAAARAALRESGH